MLKWGDLRDTDSILVGELEDYLEKTFENPLDSEIKPVNPK